MTKNNIAIIDYGVGNIRSIQNAIRFCNADIEADLVAEPEQLKEYSKIILPGVGAFRDAITKITEKGFDAAIQEEVRKGKYTLGICLGMQLLGTYSLEFGKYDGLNIIEGVVQSFDAEKHDIKIPHMGWNSVKFEQQDPLFEGINDASDFYFVHSYHFSCANQGNSLATTDYGDNFTCIVRKDNVYGVQFHPEKSQQAGLRLIKNFTTI
jgi:glutamine amidotransferase